ncbi:MAG: adenylate/guanylate cyclase domain-containing protein [Pseudomonadota bacterium]
MIGTVRAVLSGVLRTITGLGVVSSDAEVRRRQGFVNIAAVIATLNSTQHLIEQSIRDFDALQALALHNGVFALIHAATPLFHRISENAAAMWLCTAIIVGTANVIRLTGLDAGAHVYFAFTAGAFLFFGVKNWRHYLVVVVAALTTVIAALTFAPDKGPVSVAVPSFADELAAMVVVNVIVINVFLFTFALIQLHKAENRVAAERDRADGLLLAILPEAIADKLKRHPADIIADKHEAVTIFFADVVGFTTAARTASPEALVEWLDTLFKSVDSLAAQHKVEKIKTIGDAYMAVSGLRVPPEVGAARIARFAMAFKAFVGSYGGLHGEELTVRVGIHTGPVVAGVIGGTRFAYDLWGDAVNTASRMESHGEPGRIQVSASTAALLRSAFKLTPRGRITVKGLGDVETFWLDAEVKDVARQLAETATVFPKGDRATVLMGKLHSKKH